MFGSSFGSGGSGFGQVDDEDAQSAQINPGPGGPVGGGATAAGGPTPPEVQGPQALIAQLDIALQHARMAQHRLIDVPLGTIPQDQVTALSQSFATIEENIADVASRAATAQGDQLTAANRDAREVTQQVQQYVEAVEGTLTEHGVQPSAAMVSAAAGPGLDPANVMLIGAAAVAVGVVGFSLWRLQQRKKADAKEARAAARKPRKRRR